MTKHCLTPISVSFLLLVFTQGSAEASDVMFEAIVDAVDDVYERARARQRITHAP